MNMEIKEESNVNDNDEDVKDKSECKEIPSPWNMKRLKLAGKNFLSFITVEPFLICYILPFALSGLAVQQLNMEKACRVDLGYNESVCIKVVSGDHNDNITEEASTGSAKMVADMTAWQMPLQSSIPSIIILFVGAWSDRTGNRKALLMVPVIGELISSFGLILAIYYFYEWPLWVTALIESLPTALSGGLSVAFMGSYSFIADATTIESRTFRIGVVAVIVSLGIPLGTSISGLLLESTGYYGIFGIGFTLYAIGLTYTYFRVHNIRNDKVEGTFVSKFVSFFHPTNIWDTISILVVTPARQRIQIILVIIVHIIIMGPVLGKATIVYLYALSKYNMSPVDYSLFTTYSILMGTAGTAVAVTVFSKLLKMHDTFIGIIATACKTISSFLYGWAPTRNWFYVGPVVDFFGNSGTTAIRSIGTKIVDPENVGKMCSLIGLAEAFIPIVYSPMYNKLFSNTLDTLPEAVFYLSGVMTIPALIIFIVLFFMSKKEEKDVVKDPDAKEMHAYDNDVTAV